MASAKAKAEQEKAALEKQREATRICGLITTTNDAYKKNRLEPDITALALFRGKHWVGDGVIASSDNEYTASQNVVFPAVDSIVSSLALDVPAVEPLDLRYWSEEIPDRPDDLTIAGRRLGSVLNHWAHADRLDVTAREAVEHACIFGIGVIKTQWSPKLGRPIMRTRLPWEVFFDPGASRIEDATWAYELFPLHINTLRQRLTPDAEGKSQYLAIKEPIQPDTFPKGLLAERDLDEEERKARQAGLKEFVQLVEFWDYTKKRLYHIHVPTKQVLLDVPMPWGRTYDVLVFHDAVGRIRGVSDVELIASNQRDINTLVSARREMVLRLPKRMLIDRDLFEDADEFEQFKNSKTFEPTPVKVPNGSDFSSKVYVTPDMGSTIDFNAHLSDLFRGANETLGRGDYERGQAVNIRTGTEAGMVQAATQGRMNIRMRNLVRVLGDVFERMITTWKWAAQNPEAAGLDMEQLARDTQGDADAETLTQDLLEHSPKFKLLPFSPMMEDKVARRQELVNLLNSISANPALAAAFNMRELARELVDGFQLRPSMLLSEESVQAAAQNAATAGDPNAAPVVAQGGPDLQVPPQVHAVPGEM